jgi:hypothetical protein
MDHALACALTCESANASLPFASYYMRQAAVGS